LKEPEKVRASQEKALHALQQYTLAHYPDMPSKFGELLLRIPDLQRTCQVNLTNYLVTTILILVCILKHLNKIKPFYVAIV